MDEQFERKIIGTMIMGAICGPLFGIFIFVTKYFGIEGAFIATLVVIVLGGLALAKEDRLWTKSISEKED